MFLYACSSYVRRCIPLTRFLFNEEVDERINECKRNLPSISPKSVLYQKIQLEHNDYLLGN